MGDHSPLLHITCACVARLRRVQTALGDQGFEIRFGPVEAGKEAQEDIHLFLGSVLSELETAILQKAADTPSAAGIAEELGLSAQTIRRHIANVRRKICVKTTTQAVAWGLRHGIIQ